jgi:hypothetical protein
VRPPTRRADEKQFIGSTKAQVDKMLKITLLLRVRHEESDRTIVRSDGLASCQPTDRHAGQLLPQHLYKIAGGYRFTVQQEAACTHLTAQTRRGRGDDGRAAAAAEQCPHRLGADIAAQGGVDLLVRKPLAGGEQFRHRASHGLGGFYRRRIPAVRVDGDDRCVAIGETGPSLDTQRNLRADSKIGKGCGGIHGTGEIVSDDGDLHDVLKTGAGPLQGALRRQRPPSC